MPTPSPIADSVLLLEFNELSPVLMAEFIEAGHLPSFERLRSQSATFITEAGETGETLNPWVQWVTVHTGVGVARHGVRKLGRAADLTVPTVADAVTRAGAPVWLCGSMNIPAPAVDLGCYLPDPWNPEAVPHPADLRPFAEVVAANVQEHTSASTSSARRSYLRLLWFLIRHGLSGRTATSAVRQLASERRGTAGTWRRAVVLDTMQWDVFRWYHRRCRPRFATYFSNSTAHFQHLYWEDRTPVLEGYRCMDALLERILAWAGDEVTLVFCTGLSQTANPDAGGRDGFYRPRNLADFVGHLGVVQVARSAPVMAEQFHLYFDDEDAAVAAEALLTDVRLDGEPVMQVRRTGIDLLVGCVQFREVGAGAAVTVPGADEDAPFHTLFQWAAAPREGTHHPDGMLWIRGGGRRGDGGRIPLTAVAPTLLELLGIERPPTMTTPAAFEASPTT